MTAALRPGPCAGIEAYGYHGLETLLCNVERRRGGESGVASVQCLEGEAVWQAAEAGRWSVELAVAACNKVDLVHTNRKTPGRDWSSASPVVMTAGACFVLSLSAVAL